MLKGMWVNYNCGYVLSRPATCADGSRPFGAGCFFVVVRLGYPQTFNFKKISELQRSGIHQHRSQACARNAVMQFEDC